MMANMDIGLLGLIPGLGEWVAGRNQAINQPFRDRANERAMGLLGSEGTSFDDFGRMGGPAQDFDQVREASGLMANPNDFMTQMQYSLGLMGTPGYEQAGLSAQNASLAQLMGAGQRDQAQQNWMAEQAQRQDKIDADRQRVTEQNRLSQENTKITQSTGMAKDALAVVAPLRETVSLFNNVQNTMRDKGVSGMSLTDDTVLMKTLAKLMLPKEAVMSDDLNQLAQMQGLDGATRALLAQVGAGVELPADKRAELYDQIHRLGAGRIDEYKQVRQDFAGRATKAGLDVNDVLLTEIGAESGYFGNQDVRTGQGRAAGAKLQATDLIPGTNITQAQAEAELERLYPQTTFQKTMELWGWD